MMTIEILHESEVRMSPETRVCEVCHRTLHLEFFHRSGNHTAGRRRTCKRCIADAQRRTRKARGGRDRHPRYNARGDVWCNRCQSYRGAEDFKRHPNRPHTFWAYCKPCTREIDRDRYAKRTSTLERAIADQERRLKRKQKQQRKVFAERRKFLQDSILLLRRRGLSKAEIVRLTDTSFGSLLKWERGETKRPVEGVCRRFGVVVRATMGFPLDEPVHRRRLPHPAMAELLAECLPQVQAIHVRNSWVNGRRS
jgi:hypothetical protein